MNSSALLVWIPGFLGQAKDFIQINALLSKEFGSDLTFLNLSFFENVDLELGDLKNWFWKVEESLQKAPRGPIFLAGYSLGGRLALHWKMYGRISFQKVFAISTHFGLASANERALRQNQDEKWAQRFQNEEWRSLIQDWNTQSVLRGNISLERREIDYDRSRLAHALTAWSLGRQEYFFEPKLQNEAFSNVHWIVGSEDQKFRRLFETGKAEGILTPKDQVDFIENSGHRIPFEAPQELATLMAQNIRKSLYMNRDL